MGTGNYKIALGGKPLGKLKKRKADRSVDGNTFAAAKTDYLVDQRNFLISYGAMGR